MAKKLLEMSLEELWELFPIFLIEHNDKWNKNYEKIELFLKKALSRCPVERISHIGSTAVEGIWAKNHYKCMNIYPFLRMKCPVMLYMGYTEEGKSACSDKIFLKV